MLDMKYKFCWYFLNHIFISLRDSDVGKTEMKAFLTMCFQYFPFRFKRILAWSSGKILGQMRNDHNFKETAFAVKFIEVF